MTSVTCFPHARAHTSASAQRVHAASHEYIDRGREYLTGHMAFWHVHKVKGLVTFNAVLAQCACSNVTCNQR